MSLLLQRIQGAKTSAVVVETAAHVRDKELISAQAAVLEAVRQEKAAADKRVLEKTAEWLAGEAMALEKAKELDR